MNWHPADLRGRDVRLIFKPVERIHKRPVGRPPKLPVEILECERSERVWVWSGDVSVEEARAGEQFESDWRASGLEPVQAQQLRDSNCGSQARSGSVDWSKDDIEDHAPPGSTVGRPKSGGAAKADEGVIRYGGSSSGTLHIVFETKEELKAGDKVHDAIDRIERDLERIGFGGEQGSGRVIEVTYDTIPRRIPKRMSAEEVARLILEFEERTGRTDHRVAPKRRGKRKHTTPGIGRGMRPLVDPDSDQWPRDEEAGRRRIAWQRARKALRTAAEPWGDRTLSLVERIILQGAAPPAADTSWVVKTLKAALSALDAHYSDTHYQQKLDAYVESQAGKANEWLRSSSLCQQKPPLGWKTRLRSMASRSPR